MRIQQALEILTGTPVESAQGALIGMMQDGLWPTPPENRHQQRVHDQLRRQRCLYRPGDDRLWIQVKHDSDK